MLIRSGSRYLVDSLILSLILAAVLQTCSAPVGSPEICETRSTTDLSRRLVPLSEFRSGGVPKDAIPSIHNPVLVDFRQADTWLDPDAPVLVAESGGRVHGYPLEILLWHEIVNDTIGGVPIAVTYCPLCSAPFVYARRLGERTLSFGTTGKLRRSDLVMYDSQTESWWQQYTGECLVGELAGAKLDLVPSVILSYESLKSAYPGARILSRSTGFHRSYGYTPYIGYEKEKGRPRLFEGIIDKRLPPLERVAGVSAGNSRRAYRLASFDDNPVLNDEVGGAPIVVIRTGIASRDLDAMKISDSDSVPTVAAFKRIVSGRRLDFYKDGQLVRDRQTGSVWSSGGLCLSGSLKGQQMLPVNLARTFSFAWFAFYRDSDLYLDRDHFGE